MGNSRLSQLPAPAAIEETDFEGIFARKKAALTALCPESIRETVAQTLELESEPLTIDLQQQAYQELLVRNRINEAVKANLLAYAQGSDLDHIAAQYGLSRKTIRAADPDANPPVAAEYETDDAFRARVQAHPEKYAAGPRTAYEAHAIDAPPPNHTRPRRAPRRRHGGGLHQNPKRHARRNHFDRRARIPARRNTPPPLRQRASNRRPTQRRGSRVFRRIPPRRQYSSRTADRLRSLG